MKSNEIKNQTIPSSNTHQDESSGTTAPVRKRSRRRRLAGW